MSSRCDHNYQLNSHCGCQVCTKCGDHKDRARCYCGWSKDGGDGRKQLIQRGERIEPEPTVGSPGGRGYNTPSRSSGGL